MDAAAEDVPAAGGGVKKGKRTRRQRSSTLSAAAAAAASPSSSASSSEQYSDVTAEDEYMANCLIMLAQGPGPGRKRDPGIELLAPSARRCAVDGDGGRGASGEDAFECKTCNKRFLSFQALGGHRASHKKPKIGEDDAKKPAIAGVDDHAAGDGDGAVAAVPPNALKPFNPAHVINGSNKGRLHECSICGAEFMSGQALGGHMRRHRPLNASNASDSAAGDSKKERGIELDLNLPAPASELDIGIAPPVPAITTTPAAFPHQWTLAIIGQAMEA